MADRPAASPKNVARRLNALGFTTVLPWPSAHAHYVTVTELAARCAQWARHTNNDLHWQGWNGGVKLQ